MRATNMACVTPDAAISDDCKFLSVNLYARSVFGKIFNIMPVLLWLLCYSLHAGEDALANLSIEKLDTGVINGHVRIRRKMQGIALALGDRITLGKYFTFFPFQNAPEKSPSLAQKRQDKTSIELCQWDPGSKSIDPTIVWLKKDFDVWNPKYNYSAIYI